MTCFFKIFSRFLTFCGIAIHNAELYETSQKEIKRNEVPIYFHFWNLSIYSMQISVLLIVFRHFIYREYFVQAWAITCHHQASLSGYSPRKGGIMDNGYVSLLYVISHVKFYVELEHFPCENAHFMWHSIFFHMWK
jgi:hypothetical protein